MNNMRKIITLKDNINKFKKKFAKYQKKITFKSIYDLYKSNFTDNCELILLENQKIFLDKFFNKMITKIKSELGENIFEKNTSLYGITKKCENDFVKEVYWPMYDACHNSYEEFKENKINNNINKINYLTNFSSHCNYEQIALHKCGSKMLEVNLGKNYIQSFALCTGCKKFYSGNKIQGYCPFAQKPYIFKILDNEYKDEKNELEPATWEEYHCKNKIINEQMSCVNCGNLLFLKEKNLFCKNCKLDVDPLMIVWTCNVCNKKFKSKAKKYNPLEFQEEEKAIKEAFVYKIIVKPNELPCKCISNKDLKNKNFYHSKKCKGFMYFGKIKKNEIVVCSECKCFYDIKKFLWLCPICEKNFGCKNIFLNTNNENVNNFHKIKNEKIMTAKTEKNKNPIFLELEGTPLRDQRFNLSLNNNNIKSYIKKKPEDYYNYTNRNKDLNEQEFNISNNKKTKRNLSIVFKNNYSNKDNNIFDDEIKSKEKKDNNDNKLYHTNINFYKTNLNMNSTNKYSKVKNNNNSFITHTNNYIKTEKNDNNVFTKINFTSSISPKIKTNRYSSIPIRNYNGKENDEHLISDFNRINPIKEFDYKKSENIKNNFSINNYKIYVPKRKIDLNKSNLYISTNNNFDENKNINNNKYQKKKINTSNSVGTREKYKKIQYPNKGINNLDYKRNMQIILDDKEKEKDNYSFLKTEKYYDFNKINNNYNNKEFYKNIRSSSQIRTDRNENTLKNKYNKRYISSKYNYNFKIILSTKNGSNNIYQRITSNDLNRDFSTTNKSNGADSFILRNQLENINIITTNNNDTNNNKNDDKKNNNNSTDKKENSELKEFNFNDYKIITQLGQGTFGKIYLVQDKNNQLFSMKKIILSEELDVQSVINEYKMCQKINHENIVKILGIYSTKLDTTTYVVYVLMEVGLTDWEKQITSYADKKLEYSENNLIQIIKQLCGVLSFLQKNNISHRDIKPQNILVFKNDIYKLADFGEAKQIEGIKNCLVNYSLRGTELYMSPLLFNGLRNGQIDIKHNLFKSDVYSLGLCLLFAAVTKNKPLYEIRKFIDMNVVKNYLEKLLKGKYSFKFIGLLSSMLEIHEKNRPDFIELEKILKKWK